MLVINANSFFHYYCVLNSLLKMSDNQTIHLQILSTKKNYKLQRNMNYILHTILK